MKALPLIVAALISSSAFANSLVGNVTLRERGKTTQSNEQTIVYFRPDTPVDPVIPEQDFVISTKDKAFTPRVMAIPAGATVRFPNYDPILHNVFSSSRGNRFDLGLYGPDQVESQQFGQPGLVKIYCNVHQNMVANVLVLDTPFYQTLSTKGTFEFNDLPAGPGKLYVWHERATTYIMDINVPHAGPVEIELALTRRKAPKHKNKAGNSYRRERRGRY